MILNDADLKDLMHARSLLEKSTFAVKLMNVMGAPIEKGLKSLPESWTRRIDALSRASMHRALKMAVGTLDMAERERPSNGLHRALVMTSGGAAGFFGLPALALELPISTTIMMRSIADIARSEGENLHSPETQVACMEVFFLGGGPDVRDGNPDVGGVETGYYAVRAALSKAVTDAVRHLAEKGLTETGAPAIIRLISQVSSRFGIAVSEKAAAIAVPVVGSAGGAIVNSIFIDHFQAMAKGHFIIRRLERIYGHERVKSTYLSLGGHP